MHEVAGAGVVQVPEVVFAQAPPDYRVTTAIIDDIDYAALSTADLRAAERRQDWITQARSGGRGGKQLPPTDGDWEILLFLAGRGFGKTLAQVQWAWWEGWRIPNLVIHSVAPTLSDVRGTTFEGPAGYRAIVPAECLYGASWEKAYNRSLHELRFANGTLVRGFGAVEEAGRLRGPQCHALTGDELREWERPAGNLELAMNNALFGLRLPYPDGTPSRAVMGTTRRPIPYLKRFVKRSGVRVVHGTSYENLRNLAQAFRSQILSLVGTKLGRQEVDSLDIDEDSDVAILSRSWIRLWPVDKTRGRDPATGNAIHKPLPVLSFILESYDTAASEENFDLKKQETDPTASIVLGVFNVADAFTEAERKKYRIRSRYACLLLDCWSERLGLPELLDKARAQHRKKWGPRDVARRADRVLIEDKSSGPGVRQMLAKWGVPVWPIRPRLSKAMRVHAISPEIMQGMLWVPESTRLDREGMSIAWAEPFLEQVCAFAGEGSVEHDDYVDTLTQAITYLKETGLLLATPEQEFADLEDKIDHDKAEAERIYRAEKRKDREAPYG